jgi:hypothetical protein
MMIIEFICMDYEMMIILNTEILNTEILNTEIFNKEIYWKNAIQNFNIHIKEDKLNLALLIYI